MDTTDRENGHTRLAESTTQDLVVFKRERLNLERPQKLGPLDVGLIYFRRHLAQRARDYQRLGQARGALKSAWHATIDAPQLGDTPQLGDAPRPMAPMAAREPRA